LLLQRRWLYIICLRYSTSLRHPVYSVAFCNFKRNWNSAKLLRNRQRKSRRSYMNRIILDKVYDLTSHGNVPIGCLFVAVNVSIEFFYYSYNRQIFCQPTHCTHQFQVLIYERKFPQTCINPLRNVTNISQAFRIFARYSGNTMRKRFRKIGKIWYTFFIWRRKDWNRRFTIFMTRQIYFV